jgi:hypothetical protein
MTTTQPKKERREANGEFGPSFDETRIALFEADILAPEEYGWVYRKRLLSPEHELVQAVLEAAVVDFQRYISARDTKGKKRFADAEEWILSDDFSWTFSFVNVCEVLSIAPDYLRQGLLGWKRKSLTEKFKATIRPRRRVTGGRFLSAA